MTLEPLIVSAPLTLKDGASIVVVFVGADGILPEATLVASDGLDGMLGLKEDDGITVGVTVVLLAKAGVAGLDDGITLGSTVVLLAGAGVAGLDDGIIIGTTG